MKKYLPGNCVSFMIRFNLFSKTLLLVALSFSLAMSTVVKSSAQAPQPNIVYLSSYSGTIYNYNTVTNTETTNTISNPGIGLAVANNTFGVGPNPTFYSMENGIYYYWNGTSWVSTGYSTGSFSAVNPGGAGNYIYNLDGGTTIYKTDLTTGTTTTFLTLPAGWNGPWDCVGDMNGDLYLLNTSAQELNVYDVNANLICTYSATGIGSSSSGGGFAITGGKVYTEVNPVPGGPPLPYIWVGSVTSTLAITFTGGTYTTYSCYDYASYPLQNASDSVIGDTSICIRDTTTYSIYLGGGKGIWSSANSGIATVDTNGLVTGISAGTTTIYYVDTAPSNGLGGGCLSSGSSDTGHLVIHVNPFPNVSLADSASPQIFCPGVAFTLAAAQPSNTNTYQWARDSNAIPGSTNTSITSLTPGNYEVYVTTNKGCKDTSKVITVAYSTVHIDFTPQIHFGCHSDTVKIINNSEPAQSYYWDFGDGSWPQDTTAAPTHVYAQQGTYQIKLIMRNDNGCLDSLIKIIKINHPLQAAFTEDKDSLCQGQASQVHFTNTSIGAQYYQWNFDDGSSTSSLTNPNHNFTLAGSHRVRLIVSDTIPCYDTAYHIIYVDSLPFLKVIPNKTDFCTGEKVYLHLDYLSATATQVDWSFGDGTQWVGLGDQTHDYDRSGTYQIIATADYLVCPPAIDTVNVTIHDLPTVYLGSDTVLCLQGDPITLKNLAANNVPISKYQWSTGDTSASLTVVEPGIYTLTAFNGDCYTTESMDVKKDCYIDVPNAFTPNGDGENDYFFPRQYLSNGVTRFTLSIYNRWGQKIYETSKTDGRGWDGKFNGKPQPNGVYIYQIQVGYKNGRTENYSGNVTLIR